MLSWGFAGLLLLFFIGEANLNEILKVSLGEKIMLIFIPLLFIAGVVLAWKKERYGGILIVVSVLGFNIVEFVTKKQFTGELEFAFLLLPGFLFILLSFLSRQGTAVKN